MPIADPLQNHDKEMKQILVVAALVLVGCLSNATGKDEENNLLICDPYLAELENQSRYIKIDGIKGTRIESKYLTTEQRHIFDLNDLLLELNFHHKLIEDQRLNGLKVKNQNKEIRQVKFGEVEIILKPKKGSNTIDVSKQYELIKSINIKEFENQSVDLTNVEELKSIPDNLLEMGATRLERSNDRLILTLSVQLDSEKEILPMLYSNIETIYKHLKDNDLINFQSKDLKEGIVRSYVLVNSFGNDIDSNIWCGMGPKTNSFECIYIKNHNQQR